VLESTADSSMPPERPPEHEARDRLKQSILVMLSLSPLLCFCLFPLLLTERVTQEAFHGEFKLSKRPTRYAVRKHSPKQAKPGMAA